MTTTKEQANKALTLELRNKKERVDDKIRNEDTTQARLMETSEEHMDRQRDEDTMELS